MRNMIRYKMVAFVLQITLLGGVVGLCVGYILHFLLENTMSPRVLDYMGLGIFPAYVLIGIGRGLIFGFILGIIAYIVQVVVKVIEFRENIRLSDEIDSPEKTS